MRTPDLLGHLATYRRLERLPGLDETGQRREAPLRPRRLPAQQQPVVVVDDEHDDRRVGARVVLAAVDGAAPGVAGVLRDGWASRSAGSACASRASWRARPRARPALRRGRRAACRPRAGCGSRRPSSGRAGGVEVGGEPWSVVAVDAEEVAVLGSARRRGCRRRAGQRRR